jgi:uncharacterized DUF497 family protein
MEERRIAWDEAKNAENKMKHKIGFEETPNYGEGSREA